MALAAGTGLAVTGRAGLGFAATGLTLPAGAPLLVPVGADSLGIPGTAPTPSAQEYSPNK